MKLFEQSNRVWSEALDVICRHQGNGADMEIARPGAGNLKCRLRRIGLGVETQWKFLVLLGKGKRHGLAIAVTATPNQRNLHSGSGSAAKINAAGIFFPAQERETSLSDAMRRRCLKKDLRAVIAHKRI